VGVQFVMAGRTGQLGVFRPLLERLDLVMALVTFGAAVIGDLGSRLVDGGGQGGQGKQQTCSATAMVSFFFSILSSPFRWMIHV